MNCKYFFIDLSKKSIKGKHNKLCVVKRSYRMQKIQNINCL